jgi:hypothetical protein
MGTSVIHRISKSIRQDPYSMVGIGTDCRVRRCHSWGLRTATLGRVRLIGTALASLHIRTGDLGFPSVCITCNTLFRISLTCHTQPLSPS